METKEKPAKYECEFCKKVLKNSTGLKLHNKHCTFAKAQAKLEEIDRKDMMEMMDMALSTDLLLNDKQMGREIVDLSRNGLVGRPPAITEVVLHKLRFAFILGCTDLEACILSGIAERTLYSYQSEHPEFMQEKETLKNYQKMRARITVLRHLNNPEMAKWYLELKANTEFSRRTIGSSEVLHGIMTPERAERAAQILSAFDPNPRVRINNDQAVSQIDGD